MGTHQSICQSLGERKLVLQQASKCFQSLRTILLGFDETNSAIEFTENKGTGPVEISFVEERIPNELSVDYPKDQRSKLLDEYLNFTASLSDHFETRDVRFELEPNSIDQLAKLDDYSLLGGGEFVLNGNILPGLDVANHQLFGPSATIPIAQLDNADATVIDIQLVHETDSGFFVEFSPMYLQSITDAQIQDVMNQIKTVIDVDLEESKGDPRYRWNLR